MRLLHHWTKESLRQEPHLHYGFLALPFLLVILATISNSVARSRWLIFASALRTFVNSRDPFPRVAQSSGPDSTFGTTGAFLRSKNNAYNGISNARANFSSVSIAGTVCPFSTRDK